MRPKWWWPWSIGNLLPNETSRSAATSRHLKWHGPMCIIYKECQKLGKTLAGPTYKLLFIFTVISYAYKSFLPNKITFSKYCLTQWISKVPQELWNPLNKTVPGKFHRPGEHSRCNCLQDRAIFYRSRAWEIVLIFNTVYVYTFFLHSENISQ